LSQLSLFSKMPLSISARQIIQGKAGIIDHFIPDKAASLKGPFRVKSYCWRVVIFHKCFLI